MLILSGRVARLPAHISGEAEERDHPADVGEGVDQDRVVADSHGYLADFGEYRTSRFPSGEERQSSSAALALYFSPYDR